MSVTVGVNERLAALTEAGTAVWLDQIRRGMIESGELQRLIDEDSLRGVTSNPSIFEKAILGSSDYDDQISELAEQGLGAREIYDEIAVTDVQLGADVLRAVYDELGGYDGYVSLEVGPEAANDTEETLRQARDYWRRLDRPNVFIKIPGTPAGVPAIEQAIFEGINVNVTLLFAVSSYEAVAEAYIRGLERRLEAGESVDVRSVASFCVSRVDTEVDRRLEVGGALDKLLAGVESKREAVTTGRPETFESSMPQDLEPAIAERVRKATEEDVARRVWRKDETLWGGPGPEIGNRLGWLTVADQMLERCEELRAFAEACRADGLTDAVLLGMGGSSLAPEVMRRSFGAIEDGMRLHVLDSSDPGAVLEAERAIDLSKALFIVSSKPGGTIETLYQFRYFHQRMQEAVGAGAG